MPIRIPSRSATGRASRAPSTQVPWLEPASSSSPSPAEMRACVRETLGSSSWSVEPGERPITTSSTSGTRSPPASTSSSGASVCPSGAPQLPQKPAPRVTWRRHSGHSTPAYSAANGWNVGLSPVSPSES